MNSSVPLNGSLALNECSGLNIANDQSVNGIFGGGNPIASNEGEPEIIVLVKFKEKVSLTHIQINGGMDKEKNPAKVKLYAGIGDLDFSDAEGLPATETFDLSENLSKQLSVRIPKFRNLSEISLYFQNEEADQIQINNIQFFGNKGTANVDFGEMKKNPVG